MNHLHVWHEYARTPNCGLYLCKKCKVSRLLESIKKENNPDYISKCNISDEEYKLRELLG